MLITLMIILFVVGYLAIALEHNIRINKAASALVLCSVLWTVFIFAAPSVLTNIPDGVSVIDYVNKTLIIEHIGDVAEILFFLMGAMTIVELIDVHGGFSIITDCISVKSKKKLLWLIALITFFMSAVLDNLTTAIVMVMMLRKLIKDQKERWIFASVIIIAANSGGAFSPIGDVTTIMLWVNGNVTTEGLIPNLFLPSFISMAVPVAIISYCLKGNLESASDSVSHDNSTSLSNYITKTERNIIFFFGVGCLLFVPVFKTLTHLPPFIGVLFGLSLLWIYMEIMYRRKKSMPEDRKATVSVILRRIDMTTILFFFGILMAVAALQSAGILQTFAKSLDNTFNGNVFLIDLIIGFFSSIVDNVPLVAGAMGMYDIASVGNFSIDGQFWLLLAYCAGVGGSMLIIGSAAGVVVMGLEKVSFGWYLKRISWVAAVGYLAGAATFALFNFL